MLFLLNSEACGQTQWLTPDLSTVFVYNCGYRDNNTESKTFLATDTKVAQNSCGKHKRMIYAKADARNTATTIYRS